MHKIDRITATLREKKNKFKGLVQGIPGVGFRKLNDPQGECGTLLTVIFEDSRHAARVAQALGSKTVDQSGWHVYANIEHLNRHLEQMGQPHGKGAYQRTDDILSRSLNLSVGVVDAGLCSAFGININSTDAEIEEAARRFRRACETSAASPAVKSPATRRPAV